MQSILILFHTLDALAMSDFSNSNSVSILFIYINTSRKKVPFASFGVFKNRSLVESHTSAMIESNHDGYHRLRRRSGISSELSIWRFASRSFHSTSDVRRVCFSSGMRTRERERREGGREKSDR